MKGANRVMSRSKPIQQKLHSGYSKFVWFFLWIVLCLISSCTDLQTGTETTLFTLLPSSRTGIDFSNKVSYTEEFNPYTFRNFYNGGGVAIGDINNDNLPDIFFCSNQQTNRLYLNKGNFQFEDITQKAGVTSDGVWSTGVSLVDINGDGYLDIYVCKSGDLKKKNRSNELFINNGDLTFTEKSQEYGLDNRGLSTHAAFFDYDRDGDLDCYLLNNSFRSVSNYYMIKDQRLVRDSLGGNKLYRNDHNHFVDVSEEAGIYGSVIGFGLGVTISDINRDGWPDMYVSNDFFERDYLYINQQNGTFKEMLESCIRELSMNSMGADIADISNDGYPEIYVTDMFPEQEARVKTKTVFETWNKYQADKKSGFYQQFVRNTLQLNRGPIKTDGTLAFSEIGRYAGVHATDWSWGALITDMDNDGYKDIFVANGIYKDITDQDYIQYTASTTNEIRQKILNKETNIIKDLIDKIPSEALSNYAFQNKGDLTFVNQAQSWGLNQPSFSNGSAYGDLDNDGDLDLVINNVNMPCFIYQNQSNQLHPQHQFLQLTLKGEGNNRFGIGARVGVYYQSQQGKSSLAFQEQMPMRGFESSVDQRLTFGLGTAKQIDSVVVLWPLGQKSILLQPKPNQHLTISQPNALLASYKSPESISSVTSLFHSAQKNYGIDFLHQENSFADFDRDPLTFHMLSTQGPHLAKADINGDGLEDFYIGGAKDQPGALFVQTPSGEFVCTNQALFITDKLSEDTDAIFFDCDGDKDMDLYVCSGGNEFSPNSTALIDRLYINDGKGNFSKSQQVLPSFLFESSSSVRVADYDKDGDIDLFVGVRLQPFRYGYACKGYILANNGKGIFSDVTEQVCSPLLSAGMISDGQWLDYDGDGWKDLVIAGEYMGLRLFANKSGRLVEVSKKAGFSQSNGWWNRLKIVDINGDGREDIVALNHGLNSRFKASADKPVCMYVGDMDGNGTIEQLVSCYNGSKSYPMILRHDLVSVLPYLKKKYVHYSQYKEQSIEEIFNAGELGKAKKLDAYELRSGVYINEEDGKYQFKAFPKEAQWSVLYGVESGDYDEDGKIDLLIGGNLYESKPEVGIYDGSYGLMLRGNGKGEFESVPMQKSGICIKGAVRDIMTLQKGKKKIILFARNNDTIQLIEYGK
ncbi:VCBS repeat-containing protein [Cytophagaceae bacterium YF14B1]|uniref:VCBS repeat-containing protein n=2 Tax=Xanthocytophaga flava TaxID=3048013 RepID=A0AAE3QNN4_9BACT|nr:VCBS repeat-containing protein [Xanthocytophaga flavus]